MKEKLSQEGGTYWRKIKGFTSEEVERIETLETAIAKYEEDIQECKNEIKSIEKVAKARRKPIQ